MSDLLELELLELGARVAIIDDNDEDAGPIEKALDELNVSNEYFKVDFAEPKYPESPLKDVQIVFLDLHYNEGFGSDFDPYVCINWLKHIVPVGRKYVLIVWSRDIELTGTLITTMQEMEVTMPFSIVTKSKNEYRIGDKEYNIGKLLDELGIQLKEIKIDVQNFYGKILEIDEDSVLINCLINEDPKIFEIRRFDLQLFSDYISLKEGGFMRIKITTRPGSRSIDFNQEVADLSGKFIKPDNIEDFGNMEWLNTPEE